ncbi:hypothetical protein [Hypericibacter sp.]|uniref:hypothetical protein n=1 Tax=Hypericibacter sp. TaxID=2705401 RepID=UPI003D6D0ED6
MNAISQPKPNAEGKKGLRDLIADVREKAALNGVCAMCQLRRDFTDAELQEASLFDMAAALRGVLEECQDQSVDGKKFVIGTTVDLVGRLRELEWEDHEPRFES